MSPSCPPSERLRDFLAGVPATDDRILADHVEACSACQSRMHAIVESGSPFAELEESDPPVAPKESFLRLLKLFGPALEPQPSTSTPPAGTSLPHIPGYSLLDELGRGGMGIVYRARDAALGRIVAIKMLPHDLVATDEARRQLHAEAEAIARLRHPNIVQVYEFGEVDGRPFLVLEYAEGGTLRQWAASRPLPAGVAARIVEVVATAVQHAHSRNTLHGDLKPGNVLLASADGVSTADVRPENLKVSDFGLARRLDPGHATEHDFTGSPAYMAPEQVPDSTEHAAQPAHPTTDVYALGAILYELLTGRPPFTGPDWQTILLQVRHRQPLGPRQLVPGIPRDLEAVCTKCLEKSSAARYSTAAALADDLRRFLDGLPTMARPIGALGRVVRGAKRKPLLAAALAVAAIAAASSAVAGASLLVSMHRQWAMERQLLEQAEGRLYASRIGQADLLWRECDLKQAIAVLEDCPEERRGWEWYYLRALCDDGFLVLSAPPGHEVFSIATDGKRIAAVTGGTVGRGHVLVWDPEHGDRPIAREAPHAASGSRIAFLSQNRLVTYGSDVRSEGAVAGVWNVESGAAGPSFELLRERKVGPVHGLSDNGRWLAAPEPDGVAVWDLAADSPPMHLLAPAAPLSEIAVNARGSTVVGVAGKDEFVVWQQPGRDVRFRWSAPALQSIAISRDGNEVAGREAGGRFRRRSTSTGKPLHDEVLYTRLPGSTLYSPNGRFVLVHRADGVRVFDTAINQRSVLSGPRGEASGVVTALGVKPTQNGAATGESNGAIRLWELALGQPDGRDASVFRGHAGAIRAVAFDPAEKWMLSGGADGCIRGWDLSRPQRYTPLRSGSTLTSAVWSDSGESIFTVEGNKIARFDVVLGKWIGEFVLPIPLPSATALNGHYLATADREATSVRIWELPHDADSIPAERGRIEFDHAADRLSLSEDGKLLLAAGRLLSGNGSRVSARAVGDGTLLWTREESSRVVQLAFASDAKHAAILAEAGPPQVVHSSNGRSSIVLEGMREDSFRSMAFSFDGRRLAAVGERAIRVWSIENGRTVWSDTLPTPAVGLAFTADGTRLALVLGNGDVHIRESASGQELLRLPGPTGSTAPTVSAPTALSFSGDGQRLLSPSPIGPLVWEASIDRASARARRAIAVPSGPRPKDRVSGTARGLPGRE